MKKISKEKLIRILIIVSIISISIIGLRFLTDLASGFFSALGGALVSVIIPFAIAFLLSFIIGPFASLIENKLKIKRNISIIIAIIIGMLLVGGILTITITFIITQLITVFIRLLDYLNNDSIVQILNQIITVIQDRFDFSNFEEALAQLETFGLTAETLFAFIGSIFSGLYTLTASMIKIVFVIVLTPVFLYYLIKDKKQVFGGLLYLFPKSAQVHVKTLAEGSNTVIRGYFIGHGIVMLFITVFFIITYSILSFFIPGFTILHAILFALVMGLFSIIPYLGVWISMAMPIVMFLTLHFEATEPGYIYIIGIAMIFILNIVEEILESTLVQPNVFSKQVKIHPVAVLASFIFFGGLFGLVGFILAVPIAGTLKVAIHYFKHQEKPEKILRKDAKEESKST